MWRKTEEESSLLLVFIVLLFDVVVVDVVVVVVAVAFALWVFIGSSLSAQRSSHSTVCVGKWSISIFFYPFFFKSGGTL